LGVGCDPGTSDDRLGAHSESGQEASATDCSFDVVQAYAPGGFNDEIPLVAGILQAAMDDDVSQAQVISLILLEMSLCDSAIGKGFQFLIREGVGAADEATEIR
jgi:hypothetical protein